MQHKKQTFDVHELVHEIAHYLPAQAPLKDFVHHNTLHAFQDMPFELAIRKASKMFGYQVTLSFEEYLELYRTKKINEHVLRTVIAKRDTGLSTEKYLAKLLSNEFDKPENPRIGKLRFQWKELGFIDLDTFIQPRLFRVLSNYLDQGISIWKFPVLLKGFLGSIRELEKNTYVSLFKTKRARNLLLTENCGIEYLLSLLVGDESMYRQYLFDQQFAHQGWSGMVATIEALPETLLDRKRIRLEDIIVFELLLEIDALDDKFGEKWLPLSKIIKERPKDLFAPVEFGETALALAIWQEAYEFSYFDQVLAGIGLEKVKPALAEVPSFQGLFCIDDRECSIRRYVEQEDPNCATYGTPGFFNVEFYFQPEQGKFYTKLCPAPMYPKYLIKESGSKQVREIDPNFSKHSHSLHSGWLISQTLGFWSALKLMMNIFRPQASPASASSFKHMDRNATLSVENRHVSHHENGLQVGFTIEEMVDRVEGLLKSIGLVKAFSPIVYVVGHGSSSTNNPHYAAYDCGACSGRPGSVNARVVCHMANHPEVRKKLRERGIDIPDTTLFLGALQDTTRDEIEFFDEHLMGTDHKQIHQKNHQTFLRALDYNAKERSRRFASIDSKKSLKKIHEEIRLRSVSLFEPRPELNHATNALCIVGSRELSKGMFLDRRSFLNSYDYKIDPEGKYLYNILKAAAPVCGGINLEYYFSRVDNQKLGAGTKLPHNVMGLFGVANGIDGDLRPGLPSQMIEVHDPLRLMIIVEHFPEVVLKTIQFAPETFEWFKNHWIHLSVVHPETRDTYLYTNGEFVLYEPITKQLEVVKDLNTIIENEENSLPVYLFN
ncbi:MAG: DUF2309 domain-containing protein [Bacteroidetes bacterium B1(2017)]|nr:MAG: DUF2309 domain-containing protein [Bacteroidetes bacterium B1(2017)]